MAGNQTVLEDGEVFIGSDYVQKHPGVAVPYMIIICAAMTSGTIGNILVIAAVWVSKEMRNIGNIFIVNLAVADLVVTGFVNPMAIIGIVEGQQFYLDRHALCVFVASLCLTACFCSLFSMGAIALNRYIQICRPAIYNKIFTLRNTLLICLVLWVGCFIAESPNFYGWGGHKYDTKTLSCLWDRTVDHSFNIFFSSVFIFTPIVLISICYLKIYLHVRASRNRVTQAPANQEKGKSTSGKETKLATTLFVIFVVFAICWTPYAILIIIDKHDTAHQELHMFAILFGHVNSSCNSILYGILNRNFRQAYAKLLGIEWCLRKYRKYKGVDDTGSVTDNQTQMSTVLPSKSTINPDQQVYTISKEHNNSDMNAAG